MVLRYYFQMTPTAFAADLQKDWQLVSLTLHPSQTVIHVRTTVNHGVPSPVGRDGLSVMAYPAIHSELDHAEFVFQQCLFVRVWDEAALSMRESNPNPCFEGRTFRRYSKSALLDLHTDPPHNWVSLPAKLFQRDHRYYLPGGPICNPTKIAVWSTHCGLNVTGTRF